MLIEKQVGKYCLDCGEYHDDPVCPNCGSAYYYDAVEYTCDECGCIHAYPWTVCEDCGAPAHPTDSEE